MFLCPVSISISISVLIFLDKIFLFDITSFNVKMFHRNVTVVYAHEGFAPFYRLCNIHFRSQKDLDCRVLLKSFQQSHTIYLFLGTLEGFAAQHGAALLLPTSHKPNLMT